MLMKLTTERKRKRERIKEKMRERMRETDRVKMRDGNTKR